MKTLDVFSAIAVAVLWGMGFVVAKAAMDHFSPILLMALRYTVTATCLIWFFRPSPSIFGKLFVLSLVSATIQYSLTFNGLRGIDASTAILLVQLEVPFGILVAVAWLGDKLTLRQGLGIAVAFVGVFMIAGEPTLANDINYVLLVIAGAFTWAIGQVMIKKLAVGGGFALVSGMAIFAAPQLFIASLLFEDNQIQQLTSASVQAWGAVIYLGLIMTALGYAMWYRLLAQYNVNQVMPFLLLLPFASVTGGYLFLDEVLTLKIAIGGLFTLSGVAIITLRLKWRS
ncbi:MAG: EamA family transporter [Gammaproteobacteria bacterium]|jgi:O-acetylserine/cysteine efflux transporter|nr:EamA family transporter [Gammaproteobacteria bacterium]